MGDEVGGQRAALAVDHDHGRDQEISPGHGGDRAARGGARPVASVVRVEGVPGGPVDEPDGQDDQEHRHDAEGRGQAGQGVRTDEVHAVGEQPEPGGQVKGATGAAVGVRGADPGGGHQDREGAEAESGGDPAPDAGGGERGGTAALDQGVLGHMGHGVMLPTTRAFAA